MGLCSVSQVTGMHVMYLNTLMMMASIEIDSNESKLFTIFCSKITFRNILHNHTPYTEYKYTHTPPSGRSGDHLDATENCKNTSQYYQLSILEYLELIWKHNAIKIKGSNVRPFEIPHPGIYKSFFLLFKILLASVPY